MNKYLTNKTIEYKTISVLTPNRNSSGLIYTKKVASPKWLSYIHTQKKPSRTATSSQIEILVMILLFSFNIVVLEKNSEKLAHFNKSGYLCVENIIKLFKIHKTMAKFNNDISDETKEMVKRIALEMGLNDTMVTIKPCNIKKSKTEVITVVKPNEASKFLIKDENVIVVAVHQQAFDLVDEQTQELWIKNALIQMRYDIDKDKVSINKPEIMLSKELYMTYGKVLVDKLVLANEVLSQINDTEEEK